MTRLYLFIPGPAVEIGIPALVMDKLVKRGHSVSVVNDRGSFYKTTMCSEQHTETSIILEVIGQPKSDVQKNVQSIHDRMSEEEAIALPSGCSVFLTYGPYQDLRQDTLLPS